MRQNNPLALLPLLDKITEHNEMEILFRLAFTMGRKEVFDLLMRHERFNLFFNAAISSNLAIRDCAQGGNPTLLKQCLELLKQADLKLSIANSDQDTQDVDELELIKKNQQISKDISHHIKANIMSERDAISNAIDSGSTECVSIIMQQLESTGNDGFTDVDKLNYLLQAIRSNNYRMATHLIDSKFGITKELLETITMTSTAVERTNLMLLRVLRDSGVIFTPTAQSIIAKKEHQAISFISELGILLTRFTDFLVEYFTSKEHKGIFYDQKAFFFITANTSKNEIPEVEQLSKFLVP